MERYSGQSLPAQPRIAFVTNDALGNFAVATPLMVMVKRQWPDATVDYYGGSRIQELSAESEYLDCSVSWLGTPPHEAIRLVDAPYDLVINTEMSAWAKATTAFLAGENGYVVGPCVASDGRGDLSFGDTDRGALLADQRWVAEDLTERYPFLNSGHISEIWARMAYLEGPMAPYALPSEETGITVPDVLMATTASLPEKTWPIEKWLSLASRLQAAGYSIGLLGAKPSDQSKFWKGASEEQQLADHPGVTDLRGKLRMAQVVRALAETRLTVTLDNGIMHFACASPSPVIGLFRQDIHRLWAPPVENLNIVLPAGDAVVADIPGEFVEALALEKLNLH